MATSSPIATSTLPSVYWEVVHGTTSAADFNTTNGTLILNAAGRSGQFDVPIKVTASYTGDKVFGVNIYTDSSKAVLLASSANVTVKDTTPIPTAAPTEAPTDAPTVAPTEAPTDAPTAEPTAEPTEAPTDAPIPVYTYSLTASTPSVVETGAVDFTVTRTGTDVLQTVYWEVENLTNISNSALAPTSGSFSLSDRPSSDKFTVQTYRDDAMSGSGTFKVSIYSDAVKINKLSSATVTVTETPMPWYAIMPSAQTVQKGGTLTMSVTTFNVDNATTLYYSVLGSNGLAAGDVTPATGSVTVNNNTASFVLTATSDSTVEAGGTFTVALYIDSDKVTQVSRTGSISVTDVPTPAPTAAPTAEPTEAPTDAPTAAPTEAPTQAPTDAPVDPVTNFVAKANSVAFDLSFDTTLIGTPLYITADRRSTGGTDNDYVGTVTPSSTNVTLSGSSVKYSVDQVVSIKTEGYNGTIIEQTTAIAMAEPAVPTVTGFGIIAEYYYHPDKIAVQLKGATNNSFRGILRLYGSQGNGDSVVQFDRWANVTTLDVIARTGVTTNQTDIPSGSLSGFIAVFDNSPPSARLGTSMIDYPINWELYAGSNIDEVRSYSSSSGQYEWNPAKKVASTWYYQYEDGEPYTTPGGDGY